MKYYDKEEEYQINYEELETSEFQDISAYDEQENDDDYRIDFDSIDTLELKNNPESDIELQKKGDKMLRHIEFLPSILFVLVGVVFFIVGVVRTFSMISAKINCTEHVVGEVFKINVWSQEHSDSEDKVAEAYAPVFKYKFKGIEYVNEGHSYDSDLDFRRGASVDIYVDPEDPMHIYVPAYKGEMKSDIFFIVIGLGLSVIPTYIMWKRKRDDEKWYAENSSK